MTAKIRFIRLFDRTCENPVEVGSTKVIMNHEGHQVLERAPFTFFAPTWMTDLRSPDLSSDLQPWAA